MKAKAQPTYASDGLVDGARRLLRVPLLARQVLQTGNLCVRACAQQHEQTINSQVETGVPTEVRVWHGLTLGAWSRNSFLSCTLGSMNAGNGMPASNPKPQAGANQTQRKLNALKAS